jgi:hypothetical protein
MSQKLEIKIKEIVDVEEHIPDHKAAEMLYSKYIERVIDKSIFETVFGYKIETLHYSLENGDWIVTKRESQWRSATEKEIMAYHYKELAECYSEGQLHDIFSSKERTGAIEGKEILFKVSDDNEIL